MDNRKTARISNPRRRRGPLPLPPFIRKKDEDSDILGQDESISLEEEVELEDMLPPPPPPGPFKGKGKSLLSNPIFTITVGRPTTETVTTVSTFTIAPPSAPLFPVPPAPAPNPNPTLSTVLVPTPSTPISGIARLFLNFSEFPH